MNEVTMYVQEQLNGGADFQPTWMLVAQWDRVHPDPHGANSHEGVSEDYLSKVWYNAHVAARSKPAC